VHWIQSFPQGTPDDIYGMGRSFVLDRHCETVYTNGFDYRRVFESLDDDVILIEWDIAIGPSARARFEQHALRHPLRIQVAPYKLYPVSTNAPDAIWAHRELLDKPVERFAPWCNYFGFGAIYLPLPTVKQYLSETSEDVMCLDQTFSIWHQLTYPGIHVPIHWDVRVIHLHF
jgi:hypothetical protein